MVKLNHNLFLLKEFGNLKVNILLFVKIKNLNNHFSSSDWALPFICFFVQKIYHLFQEKTEKVHRFAYDINISETILFIRVSSKPAQNQLKTNKIQLKSLSFCTIRSMDDNREALISRNSRKYMRCVSHAQDELHSFRSYLRWMCVDQSTIWTACLSWSMFVIFTIVVPAISHFVLACPTCDSKHDRPYDTVVQLSLSSVATLSFVCLSTFVRKYGLRRFLFFDKLWDDSETVRRGYTQQLNVSHLYYFFSFFF